MDIHFLHERAAQVDGALAMGVAAEASGVYSVALGDEAEAIALQSVALGAGSVADRDHCVSIGRFGAERNIAHVAGGVEATDAVNLAQLSFVASALGDEVRCIDGVFYVPVHRIQGIDYRTVGAALTAINRHLGQLYAQLADVAPHPPPPTLAPIHAMAVKGGNDDLFEGAAQDSTTKE